MEDAWQQDQQQKQVGLPQQHWRGTIEDAGNNIQKTTGDTTSTIIRGPSTIGLRVWSTRMGQKFNARYHTPSLDNRAASTP